MEQYVLQNGKCFYTNQDLIPSSAVRFLHQPSLDRIDNSVGYVKTNVKLTSWGWNVARGANSIEETLKFWRLNATQA